MQESIERVRRFYDRNPDREWRRLTKDAYHELEFETTTHFISKCVTHPSSKSLEIIDIGGGPGRYALWLLKRNHFVTLVDLSEGLLKKAREEIGTQGLSERFRGAYQRDASSLEEIASDQFDLTLLLGPIYHLTAPQKRLQAMNEAARVTRPGGWIFTSIINRLCPIRDQLMEYTETFCDELEDDYESVLKLLNTGTQIQSGEGGFTDVFFAELDEVPRLYEQTGVDLIETFSCEGIASFLNEKADLVRQRPVAWERLLDLVRRTATEPSLIGAGEHTVFVGRKRESIR